MIFFLDGKLPEFLQEQRKEKKWQCFPPAHSIKTKSLNETCINQVMGNANLWGSKQHSRWWAGRCNASLCLLTLLRQSRTRHEITLVTLTRWRTPYWGLAGLALPSARTWMNWGFLTSVRSYILQQQLWLLLCDHFIVWKILHFCRIKLGVHFIKAAATFSRNVYLHVIEYVQMRVGWWSAF